MFRLPVIIAAMIAAASVATAQDTRVYTCGLAPISQVHVEHAFDYRLTIAPDGGARIEGVKIDGALRFRENTNKLKMNWAFDDIRIFSVIDKRTNSVNLNLKREGYIGELRWKGVCK